MELDGSFIFALQPILVIFGSLLNSLQLYLAIFETPKPLKRYSIFIVVFALADIGSSVGELVSRTRIIASPVAIGMVSVGICSYSGPKTCYAWQSITAHFMIYSVYLMFVSFGYRYYVIYRGPTSVTTIFLSLGISYIPSFIQVIAYTFAQDDPELVRQVVQQRFPHYDLSHTVVSGNLNYSHPAVLYTCVNMVLSTPLLYAGILYFRKKVLWKLQSLSRSLSNHTKSMHEQLLKALTFQAMLPALFAIGSGSFAIAALDIAHHPILEHLVMTSCCASPALSPLGSILFIKPYRDFVKRRLLRRPLYLAIFKTPEPLRRYSILIIAFALTDIGTSIGEIVGRTRMVAWPQALGMVSIGLCTYGGPISCYIWQSITGHFLIYSVYLMFVSFGYRYYVIYHGPTSVKAILMSIGISYIPSFTQVIVHCLAMDDPELVRQAVQRRFPHYNLTNTVVSGNLDYTRPVLLYLSVHMTCSAPFLYAGILYFRRKALTFQAMLPALFAIGSASFAIAVLDIAHNLFLEHLVLCEMELDGSISFALQPILVVFGFLLNCLQLYLAACKTPEPLKRYSILIIVFAVTDIGTSIGELVSRIRIIAFPQAIVFVSNGLCTYGGPISCYLWQSITAHFMIYSVYLMFLSFGYRYYVIYHGSTSVMAVFISVGISYVPSFIQVVRIETLTRVI
ncbi:unnamed protein product [Caenorhabditis auriculariae]|uniref:G protein-coupled receptor n=1 Tax=Caenorhabditis auriculariae TaxID=2777116 RepID=A0A8S1HC64_9PELO|nr:unnamed protein product [Caenorhabditis auriculariae]